MIRQPGVRIIGLAALASPLAAICQQLALFGLSIWCSAMFGSAGSTAIGAGDAIYSRLILGMLGGAAPLGLAVRVPFATVLQSFAPQVLPGASRLPAGTWIGVVFAPGSSAVGVQVLQVAVNLAMVALGSAALLASYLRTSWRPLSCWPGRAAALLCLAYGAGNELELSWGGGSGGEMALAMVATKVVGLDSRLYEHALRFHTALSLAINFALVGVAAAVASGLALLLVRASLGRRRLGRLRVFSSPDHFRRGAVLVGVSFGLLLAPAQQAVMFATPRAAANPAQPSAHPPMDQNASKPTSATAPEPAKQPSIVTIHKRDGAFEYQVNGRLEVIRGMGYNAVTTGESPQERAARYDRDFQQIDASGVNTIVGWSEGEFDQVLLDEAGRHSLGVILPFELRPAWAYDDSEVRRQLFTEITDWVQRYKDSPALRIWGLGNEVIHDMAGDHGRRGKAFAGFLVQAADLVHALDPNHPVVYRDAEDVYLAPLAAALRSTGEARPWFIYGMNFFTSRMDDALTRGPALSLRQPLLISEFGPVGLRPADRPAGYSRLWNIIARHQDRVLGGCAYVWTTAGPEPLDRSFGLTDAAGEPVDGSLAALATLFSSGSAADLALP